MALMAFTRDDRTHTECAVYVEFVCYRLAGRLLDSGDGMSAEVEVLQQSGVEGERHIAELSSADHEVADLLAPLTPPL